MVQSSSSRPTPNFRRDNEPTGFGNHVTPCAEPVVDTLQLVDVCLPSASKGASSIR